MKWYILIVCSGLFVMLTSFSSKIKPSSSCDIDGFYSGREPESNTLVLTSNDELVEAKLVLVPTKMDIGSYTISITRKGSNLYKIDGENIYIKTRYCNEYTYRHDVVLEVESSYGYNKGKLIF
jgi:hypothetical protein